MLTVLRLPYHSLHPLILLIVTNECVFLIETSRRVFSTKNYDKVQVNVYILYSELKKIILKYSYQENPSLQIVPTSCLLIQNNYYYIEKLQIDVDHL